MRINLFQSYTTLHAGLLGRMSLYCVSCTQNSNQGIYERSHKKGRASITVASDDYSSSNSRADSFAWNSTRSAGEHRRNRVRMERFARELREIPPELRGELMARMCVAVSTGLFDGAMNYAWNATVL